MPRSAVTPPPPVPPLLPRSVFISLGGGTYSHGPYTFDYYVQPYVANLDPRNCPCAVRPEAAASSTTVTATLRVPDDLKPPPGDSVTGRPVEVPTHWQTVLRIGQRAGTLRARIQRTAGGGAFEPVVVRGSLGNEMHDDMFTLAFPVAALPPGVYAFSVALNGQQYGEEILFEARESAIITSITPPCSPTFGGPPVVISGRRFGTAGSDVRVRFRAVSKGRPARGENAPSASVPGTLRDDGKIVATPPSATFDGYFAVAVSFNAGVSFSDDDVHDNAHCGMSFYREPHLMSVSPSLGSASGGYPLLVRFAFRYSAEGRTGRITRDVPVSETSIVDEGQIRVRFVVVPRPGAPTIAPVVVRVVPAALDAERSLVTLTYPRDLAAETFRYSLSDTLRVELALNGTNFAGALEYVTCRPVQIAGLSVGYGPTSGGTEVDIILAEGIVDVGKYDVRIAVLDPLDAVVMTFTVTGLPSTARRPRAENDYALGAVSAISIVMPAVADAVVPTGRNFFYARLEVALNGIDYTETQMGVSDFVYYKAPVVVALTPNSGPWTGGTLAVVRGLALGVVRDAARESTRRRAAAAVRFCLACFEALQSFPAAEFIAALESCHLGRLTQCAIRHTIATIVQAGRFVRAGLFTM